MRSGRQADSVLFLARAVCFRSLRQERIYWQPGAAWNSKCLDCVSLLAKRAAEGYVPFLEIPLAQSLIGLRKPFLISLDQMLRRQHSLTFLLEQAVSESKPLAAERLILFLLIKTTCPLR